MCNNPEQCSSIGSCPFAPTEESAIAQNYGCLPTPIQIAAMRVENGKTWACHSDPSKPCLGALKWLKERNLPYKVIETQLITEDDDWNYFIPDQNSKVFDDILSKDIAFFDINMLK